MLISKVYNINLSFLWCLKKKCLCSFDEALWFFILTLFKVNVNVLTSGYNVYYLLSHPFSPLVRRPSASRPFSFGHFFGVAFFLGSVFYFHIFKKVKSSVSGLDWSHRSCFRFMSRPASFLFKCVLGHVCTRIALTPPLLSCSSACFIGVKFSPPWLEVGVWPAAASLIEFTDGTQTLPFHLLPLSSVYPNPPSLSHPPF